MLNLKDYEFAFLVGDAMRSALRQREEQRYIAEIQSRNKRLLAELDRKNVSASKPTRKKRQ